jgi:hypothetical protein
MTPELGKIVKYTDEETGKEWPAIITAIEDDGDTITGLVMIGSKDIKGEVKRVTIQSSVETSSKVAREKKS